MAEELSEIQTLLSAWDFHSAQFGPYHPETIAVANKLAIAFWSADDVGQAVGLLDQTLDGSSTSIASEHPARMDVLRTLGEILVEHGHWERASSIYREVVECCNRRFGKEHLSSLAAKGDLAVTLFELGHQDAAEIEGDAFESARLYLGETHSVTCVLAWNRVLRHESVGNLDAAREIIVTKLSWLLTAEEVNLEADQKTIRTMLSDRLNWNNAKIC